MSDINSTPNTNSRLGRHQRAGHPGAQPTPPGGWARNNSPEAPSPASREKMKLWLSGAISGPISLPF